MSKNRALDALEVRQFKRMGWDGYYPSTPDISFHSSHGHITQNIAEDTCYTPTAQLKQLLTTLKEENSTLLNAKNRLTENNNIAEQRNKQLAEENDNLSKEIREKSTENKALKERITILEHAFSAILEENNKMKTSDWKLTSYSNKSRSNYGELKETPQTIQTTNRYTSLKEENEYENGEDCSKFFSSQCLIRRIECYHIDRETETLTSTLKQSQRKSKHKKKVVFLGDSQLKYTKSENLATKETQVTVKSISGLKVEQVQDKLANDLNSASESHVIVHAGANNVKYSSVGTLLSSYEDLAEHLKRRCDKVGFSSIILRNDKPELNGKIELLNEGIHEICKKYYLSFINNGNITANNLARDGLHINRSRQTKLTANFSQLFS